MESDAAVHGALPEDPQSHPCFKSRRQVPAFRNVSVPDNQVLRAGPCGSEAEFNVLQDLLGLGADVTLAGDFAIAVDRVLSADVHSLHWAAHGHDLREGRIRMCLISADTCDSSSGIGFVRRKLVTSASIQLQSPGCSDHASLAAEGGQCSLALAFQSTTITPSSTRALETSSPLNLPGLVTVSR